LTLPSWTGEVHDRLGAPDEPVVGQLPDGVDAKGLLEGGRVAAGQPQGFQRRVGQLVEVRPLILFGHPRKEQAHEHQNRPVRHATEAGADRQPRGVTRRYGQVTAVDGLPPQLHAGQMVALLGPNGADKTTTVELLLGPCQPDTG